MTKLNRARLLAGAALLTALPSLRQDAGLHFAMDAVQPVETSTAVHARAGHAPAQSTVTQNDSLIFLPLVQPQLGTPVRLDYLGRLGEWRLRGTGLAVRDSRNGGMSGVDGEVYAIAFEPSDAPDEPSAGEEDSHLLRLVQAGDGPVTMTASPLDYRPTSVQPLESGVLVAAWDPARDVGKPTQLRLYPRSADAGRETWRFSVDEWPQKQAGSGNRFYYTEGNLLGRVDISENDPRRVVRQMALDFTPLDIAAIDDNVFVSDGDQFTILRDSEGLTQIARVDAEGEIRSIRAARGHLYVFQQHWVRSGFLDGSVTVLDVTDPAKPARVGRVEFPAVFDLMNGGLIHDFGPIFAELKNDLLLLAAHELIVVDVMDAASPRIVHRELLRESAHGLVLSGSMLIVAEPGGGVSHYRLKVDRRAF